MLHALCAFRRSCRVHGRIASADYNHVLSDIKIPVFCFKLFKELQRIDRFPFFQTEHARFRSAHSKDNCCVSGIFKHIQIRDL